jgi:TonB family protein
MSPASQEPLFSLLPDSGPPWWKVLFSLGAEVAIVLIIGFLVLISPVGNVAAKKFITSITLVDNPPPVNHAPQPIRKLTPPPLPPLEEIKTALKMPAPILPKPKPEEDVTAPKIEVASKRPVIDIPAPKIPKALVKTGDFTTGSSAPPTIARAPEKVQTGGFGDPNGIPTRDSNSKAAVNIAKVGSFDLPNGGGSGNGTGGEKGLKGVVASSGFGNGVAQGDGSGKVSASRVGSVQQSGFGDAAAAARNAPKTQVAATPHTTPVEVISKPTPVYTEEGRRLKIEGEVVLMVSFEAVGRVRVVQVMQGLGHGLDEAAVHAAEQIRFKPATRDGQPSDSTAKLHIVFQLT